MATTPPPSYWYYPLLGSDTTNTRAEDGSVSGSRLISSSNNSSLLSLSSLLRSQESQTMMQELRDQSATTESGTSTCRNSIWSAAGLKRGRQDVEIWPFSTSANLLLDHPAVAAKIHTLDNATSELTEAGATKAADSETGGGRVGSPSPPPLRAPLQLGEPQASESAAVGAALPPASQFILSSYVKPLVTTTTTTSETAPTRAPATTDSSNSSSSSAMAPTVMPGTTAKRPRLSSTSSRSDHHETVSANGSVASTSSPTVVRKTTAAAGHPISSDGRNTSTKTRPPKKRYLTNEKRLERNAREQARSNRLSEQFAELRHLLETAGIVVPKGTKGSILCIAMDYIRRLQEEATKKDSMDVPPSLLSGGGGGGGDDGVVHTSSPSSPHMMVNNNKSENLPYIQNDQEQQKKKNTEDETEQQEEDSSDDDDCFFNYYYYRFAFEHCTNGMAITTLGGSFVKSNQQFRRLTKQTQDQLQHLSIFNFTAPEDLSYTFDKLSQVLLVADHQNQQQKEKSTTYLNDTVNCYCPPPANIIEVQSSIPGGICLRICPILCDQKGHNNRLLVTLVPQKQPQQQQQLEEAVSSFTGTSANTIKSLPSGHPLLQSFPLCPAPPPSPLLSPRITTRTADTSSVTEDCSDHSCTSSGTYYSGVCHSGEDGMRRIGTGSSTSSNHHHDGAMIAPTTSAAAAAHQDISTSDSTNFGDDTLTALRAMVASTNAEIKTAAAQAKGFYTTG